MSETGVETTYNAFEVETWEKNTPGGVWILSLNARGDERPKRIKGPSGYRFKVQTREREASGARFVYPAQDPFLNGTFKRVDVKPEAVVQKVEGYDVENALSDADLLALLTSTGNAFQSRVKKLTERNVRRLADLFEDDDSRDLAKRSQVDFVKQYIAENYAKSVVITED